MSLLEKYPTLYNKFYPSGYSKSLKFLIDCDSEHRKICKGLCCRKSIGYGRYFPEEIEKVPEHLKKHLTFKDGSYLVESKDECCVFIEECLKDPTIKPIQCTLFPIKVSKQGNLYVHRYAWLNCPAKKGKKPIWQNLKEELILVFGLEFYNKLEENMTSKQTEL